MIKYKFRVNEISFTYNFGNILIYNMYNFHVATIFHWFHFSPESQPSKMQILKLDLPLKSSPSTSDVLYDLFLLARCVLIWIEASTAETHIFVHPTLTEMAAPCLPC